MINYIIQQWKTKRTVLFLMILGFFAAALVLSFSISIFTDVQLSYEEDTEGDPSVQVPLTVQMFSSENGKEENISSFLNMLTSYGEVQFSMTVMAGCLPDGKPVSLYVLPVVFERQESWHVPMLSGHYLTKREVNDSEIQILLGKDLAQAYGVSINDEIQLSGFSARVTGIIGRDYRKTKWDNYLYISIWDYTQIDPFCLNKSRFNLLLKNGRKAFIQDLSDIKAEWEEKGIRFTAGTLEERIDTRLQLERRNAVTSGVLIYFIATVNIINLMVFRMSERKKDIAVLKALGASDRWLMRSFLLENLIISLMGCFAALLFQWIISIIFDNYLITEEFCCRLSWRNILVSSAVSLMAGLIASVVPLHQALSLQISEVMKQV